MPRVSGYDGRDIPVRGLVALGAAALVLRLVVLGALWQDDPLARSPVSDARYYLDWASAIAAGEPWREGLPHWLPPLYPWVLGAAALAGLPLPGGAVVLHALLGTSTTLLVALLAARFSGARAGLCAGAIWTLQGSVLLHESRLLGVNVALPLCAAALLAWREVERRVREGRNALAPGAGAGLAGGLAALVHPNLLLATPLVGVAVVAAAVVRGARGAAFSAAIAAALGFGAGLAPGFVSNFVRSGEPVLVTANGGVNFWLGNRTGAGGTFEAPGPEWGSIERQRDVSVALASAALGRDVTEREASRWWFRRALSEIAADPAAALARVGRKLAASISSEELDVQVVLAASRRAAPISWLAPVPFGIVCLLAVLGVRSRGAMSAATWAWLAAGIVGALLYFHYPRFRLTWALALMPAVGAGAVALVQSARARRMPRGWIAALLLAAASFAVREGDLARRHTAHARVDQGVAWRRLSEPARAQVAFKDALALHHGEVRARVELAAYEQSQGRREVARELLLEALALPVDYPRATYELVALELGSADAEERERGLERARAWLAGVDASHPERRAFELLLIGGLVDRARRSSGDERAAWLAEARRRLATVEPVPGETRDMRALVEREIARVEAGR